MIRVHVRKKPDRDTYQLYYIDPLTGRDVTKSAKTHLPREADRAAAAWEIQVNATVGQHGADLSWDQFRHRYEDEHLAAKSKKMLAASSSAMNWFERAIGHPKRLSLIDSAVISRTQAAWRSSSMTESTIKTHLGHLRAAFGWARKMGYIATVPHFAMPKVNRRLMKGRPLTVKECRQMLRATKKVIGTQWRSWVRFQHGLWLSGLRLAEAAVLSWDMPPIRVQLDGAKYPRLVIHAEGQKSRRDEIVPITPDFAAFLKRTPASDRHGLVMPLYSTLGDQRRVSSSKRIGIVGTSNNLAVYGNGTKGDSRASYGTAIARTNWRSAARFAVRAE